MSFQPAIPIGGNAGWAFLQRTRESQEAAFQEGSAIKRDVDYFRENIGSITTAEQLVGDRRIMSVALGAFGLDDDLPNKFFIQKVLQEGTLNDEAFANKLSDKRYRAMSEAFGFELQPANTQISTFADKIISQYQTRQFEIAVGNQDENMRLALGVERELENLLGSENSEDGYWFTVMATPPLRAVFEGALRLPSSLGSIDIDKQLDILKNKAQSVFGDSSVSQFASSEKQEDLIRRFLVSSETANIGTSTVRGSVALSLLQTSQAPAQSNPIIPITL